MSSFHVRNLIVVCQLVVWAVMAPLAQAQVTPVTREPVEFPREAVKAGVDKGEVKVKVTIDATGNVTDVQIIEAKPPRVFDRAVRSSMAKWKFNAGDANRSYETVVEFKR
ncbi:MAG: energy transducer TonB [Burkholderiales bacterium]|nr:energy transducer TonB [Burkholderiales bacterium]